MAGRILNGYTPVNPTTGNGSPVGLCRLRSLGPPPVYQRVGHGMNCAGIIAASHNNSIGIAGVAPNSLVYPINIFAGGELVADIIDGISKAWDPAYGNADIISNSWGYNTTIEVDAGITAEIIDARTYGRVRGGIARGCVVVFASGNHHGIFSGVAYPANVTGVISVGAIDHNGNIHSYSSRGSGLQLVAPSGGASGSADIGGCEIPSGGNIWTTDRPGTNGYAAGDYFGGFNGTSAAAPQVAGVAALMLSVNPNLTEAQVRTILQQTAKDLGTTGYDNTYGYGLVNAEKAVEIAVGGPISGPDLFCTTGSYSLSGTPPGAVTWSGTSGNFSVNSSTGVATRYLDGPGYVEASIASGCGSVILKKLVYSGVPYYDHLDAEAGWLGSGQGKVLSPWGNTQMEAGYTLFMGSEVVSILEYGWEMQNHSNWYVTPLTLTSIEMNYWSLPNPTSQTIHIRARNSCGWGSYKATYWTVSTFFAKYSISPNPTSGYVTLLFEDLIDPKGLPESLELMHESSTIPVRTLKIAGADFDKIKNNSNKLSIDVRDLPRGTYYLHVGYGDKKKPDRHRVLLE
jgi:serine protease